MINRLLCFFLFLPLLAFGDVPKGEQLLNRLWKDIKAGKINKIHRYTSKRFQATSLHGTFNRQQEMEFLQKLKLLSYKLEDVRVTQGENVITITYHATAQEIIGTNPNEQPYGVLTVPSWRLAVWKRIGKQWKWVAEANWGLPVVLAPTQP